MRKAHFLGGTMVYRRVVWGIGLLLITAIIAVLPRLVLAPWISGELKEFIAQEFHAEQVQVELSGTGWALVLGYIPAATIELENGAVNGFPVTYARLFGEGVRFQPWTLFKEREFFYAGSQFLRLSARVSAESLSEYFKEHVPNVQDLKVEAEAGQLVLSGAIDLLGVSWHMALSGTLKPAGPTGLQFVPVGLKLEQAYAPPALVDILQEYFTVIIDLDKFPFPVRISHVEAQGGGINLIIEEVAE